jgi:DNA-binding MarR family transcriptional regulator
MGERPGKRKAYGCTCFRLRRATRLMTQIYDHALAPVGLTVGQYSLLSILMRAEGASIGELADEVDMDPTTLTRNLQPLQREGLLRIAVSEKDRRVRMVFITEKGKAKRAEAGPLWRAAQDRVDATLGETVVGNLDRLLDASLAKLAVAE